MNSPNDFKYFAFLSYRHLDNDPRREGLGNRWADWIHDACERWRTPHELVGKTCRNGTVPERCFPLFQDTKELPTAADLGEAITSALDQSRYLVVICPPRATESRYLNAEICHFKATGRGNAILPIIIDGEPNASESQDPEIRKKECFPPALLFKVNENGEILTGERDIEPICADTRNEYGKEIRIQDRKNAVILETAKLKIIAGLIGVNFDELAQRDKVRQIKEARKRLRNMVIFSVILSLLFLVSVIAAIFAWNMKQEATRQRDQARRNSDLLIKNITPLAFHINIDSNDLKARSLTNSFISNCRGVFMPQYDPSSLENSFHAAVMSQLSANAIMVSVGESALFGKPLTEEELESVQDAMKYVDNMEQIYNKILQNNDINTLNSTFSFEKGELDFYAIQSEVFLARGALYLRMRKYSAAKADLEKFIKIISGYQVTKTKVNMYYNLFEGFSNLSHVFRLENDPANAMESMRKSLENGIKMAEIDPQKNQILFLRYGVAKYLGVLDKNIEKKIIELMQNAGIEEKIIHDYVKEAYDDY